MFPLSRLGGAAPKSDRLVSGGQKRGDSSANSRDGVDRSCLKSGKPQRSDPVEYVGSGVQHLGASGSHAGGLIPEMM